MVIQRHSTSSHKSTFFEHVTVILDFLWWLVLGSSPNIIVSKHLWWHKRNRLIKEVKNFFRITRNLFFLLGNKNLIFNFAHFSRVNHLSAQAKLRKINLFLAYKGLGFMEIFKCPWCITYTSQMGRGGFLRRNWKWQVSVFSEICFSKVKEKKYKTIPSRYSGSVQSINKQILVLKVQESSSQFPRYSFELK